VKSRKVCLETKYLKHRQDIEDFLLYTAIVFVVFIDLVHKSIITLIKIVGVKFIAA